MIILILLTFKFKANYNFLNLNDYFEIKILTLRRLIRDKKNLYNYYKFYCDKIINY